MLKYVEGGSLDALNTSPDYYNALQSSDEEKI